MGNRLRRTVIVGGTAYVAGSEVPDETAALITNPDAWEPDDEPDDEPESKASSDSEPDDEPTPEPVKEARPRSPRRSQS